MTRLIRLHIGCCLLLSVLANPSWAEHYALLIGVSAYPSLKDMHLVGPANDVQLMRELLRTTGFAALNIRVLADGVPGTVGLPTRDGILGELKALTGKAQKGDFVYLQFGGHGAQQPSRPGKTPPEADGLDEIFLPRDIGKWDGGVGSVQNALLDEELGSAITDIRAKGAFVWAVFDNCHSGNITRGGRIEEVRERNVDPLKLGIPQEAIDQAVTRAHQEVVKTRGGSAPGKSGALGAGNGKEGLGGYVFFYAAQSNEKANEWPIPEGQPGRKPQGIFTWSLAQVIAANPGISYRQAGERVLQLFAGKNVLRSQTPLFEGNGLDAPLFAQKAGEVVRQWGVTFKDSEFEIAAGSLHQFGEGAIFAALPHAAAKEADVIGYLHATRVSVSSSKLAPIERHGKPMLKGDKLPRDAVVRVVDPALNLSLRVALPVEKPSGSIGKALETIRSIPGGGLKIEWVAPDQPADLRLAIKDNKLWLLPPDGTLISEGDTKTPFIAADKPAAELQKIITSTLQKVAKVTNLSRLSGQMMSSRLGARVNTRYFVTRAKTGKKEEIPAGTVPRLETGDQLQLMIRNNHIHPVDITVLGVDAFYGVSQLFPLTQYEENRIMPVSTLTIPGESETPIKMDGATVGQESIMVLAVEAKPSSPMINLGFLAQDGVMRTRGGGQETTIEQIFADAGDGGQRTRGANREAALENTVIQMFNYRAVK